MNAPITLGTWRGRYLDALQRGRFGYRPSYSSLLLRDTIDTLDARTARAAGG